MRGVDLGKVRTLPPSTSASLFMTWGCSLSKYQHLCCCRLGVVLHSEVWSPLGDHQNNSAVCYLSKKIQRGCFILESSPLKGSSLSSSSLSVSSSPLPCRYPKPSPVLQKTFLFFPTPCSPFLSLHTPASLSSD